MYSERFLALKTLPALIDILMSGSMVWMIIEVLVL